MHNPGPASSAHTPIYLDTSTTVDAFLASIADTPILALDTEGASFHRFVDRIYLLQLSTREQTAIIDPMPIGQPAGLGRLLEDPTVEIVFHDADYDLRLLHQDYGWHARNIFDTRVAAQLLGLRAFGLAALLERYFGVKLDKKHQRADWSMRPLTQGMLDYAAQDTIHLLELRDRLKAELERAGRWEWAREEFALLEGTRWPDEDPANAFLRHQGRARPHAARAGDSPRAGAVARRRRAQLDRATFRVVGNEQLLEIVARKPTTRDALARDQGHAARHDRVARRRDARRGAARARRAGSGPAALSRRRRAGIAIPISTRASTRSRPCATRRRRGSISIRACCARATGSRRCARKNPSTPRRARRAFPICGAGRRAARRGFPKGARAASRKRVRRRRRRTSRRIWTIARS